MKLKQIQARKAEIVDELRQIQADAATNTDGFLNEAQVSKYNSLRDEFAKLDKQEEFEQTLAEQERSMSAVATIEEQEEAKDRYDAATAEIDATGARVNQGFKSTGDYLTAIVAASRGIVDERLRLNYGGTATGAGEGVPSDGGFLVQHDHAAGIMQIAHSVGNLLGRLRRIPIGPNSNGLKMNAVDETSRVNGSRYGGVTSSWAGEGDPASASKPKFRQISMELKKLIGLMYATDELLQDSTAMTSIFNEAFGEEIAFMVEDAVINGSGAGQPLGILNSSAVVSVAKTSGQAADTFTMQNAADMLARLWIRSRQNAVWLINQDVEPQLYTMADTAGNLIYAPAGRFNDSPFGTLLGRPVIPVEYCATLGDAGDVILADLSQYLFIDKGTPKTASSMHVRFVNDETAFRMTYRCNGQPSWSNKLTPKNGTNTISPFVTLAERA